MSYYLYECLDVLVGVSLLIKNLETFPPLFSNQSFLRTVFQQCVVKKFITWLYFTKLQYLIYMLSDSVSSCFTGLCSLVHKRLILS